MAQRIACFCTKMDRRLMAEKYIEVEEPERFQVIEADEVDLFKELAK